MDDMKSSRWTAMPGKDFAQHVTDIDPGTELNATWESVVHPKAALRHIENRVEAAPGTGVFLDSVMNISKMKSSRTVRSKDDLIADEVSSKRRRHSQQSLDKSRARSPLKNTTHDGNVSGNNRVEFREPLNSYREASLLPQALFHLKLCRLHSLPQSSDLSSLPASYSLPSQLAHQGDARGKKEGNVDSKHSSPSECTDIRYLNGQPALDRLLTVGQSQLDVPLRVRTEEDVSLKVQSGGDNLNSSPCAATGTMNLGQSILTFSPGSASQRLENLRRHQHDDKLEKLRERIRKQRQHLLEAAEREKVLGHLEQPISTSCANNSADCSNMAKIRKVAPAPPPPVYKGFNSTETKIQTPDGRVWKEQEFQDLSREIYRDLSRQFAETTRSRQKQQRENSVDRSKERLPTKPVRKVHRVASTSDPNTHPVISPASWREGQKRVKMVLGPVAKLSQEDRSQPHHGFSRTASLHHPSISRPSDPKLQSHPDKTECPWADVKGQKKRNSIPSSTKLSKPQTGVTAESLSADIQGILDDLQLEYKMPETEEKTQNGNPGKLSRGRSASQTRTPFSAWGAAVAKFDSSRGCRSASPSTRQKESASASDDTQKKRHYDAETVRQYISRQKEERKRRQVEEKKALKEQEETKKQRLQDLYRKQREMAKTASLPSEAQVHNSLQGTYTKLTEEARVDERTTWTQHAASKMRPIYQPSGESDKENKTLGAPQSPSSSDRSLNGQQPLPLSTNDLDVTPLFEPHYLSPAERPATGPRNDRLLSQFLKLEPALTVGDNPVQHPATVPSGRLHKKMSRIEFIKTTAASLSNRLEYEARRLAGEGLNCGTVTSVDLDTALASRPSQGIDDDQWCIKTSATENKDMLSYRSNRGHASYNDKDLPGLVSLHAFNGQKEMNPQSHDDVVAESSPKYPKHERGKLFNGLEMPKQIDKMTQLQEYEMMLEKGRTDTLDSSPGSISEGPLLSEGSFSEDEVVRPHFKIAARHIDANDQCAGQPKEGQRLSEFQREAARFSALNSVFGQHSGGKSALDELNKGSPMSIVNIFTKNLPCSIRVNERNSPSNYSVQCADTPVHADVYEEDFESLPNSEANDQSKKNSNLSTNNHFEDLKRRSPPEKSTGDGSHHSSYFSSGQSPHLSSGSASHSSPFSKHSTRKKGQASDHSDATLVEEQMSSCSPPSEPLSFESWKRSSVNQSKNAYSNDISERTSHKGKKMRAARSKQVSVSPSETVGSDSPVTSSSNTYSDPHIGKQETHTAGDLQYSPATLQQRMAAELQYLESIEESMRQLGDVERRLGVSMAQRESVSLAKMLQAKQQRQESDLLELKINAERNAMEARLQLEESRQKWARAHMELQEGLAVVQKQTLAGLQEATVKMSQQAEAVQHTADASRHIKEMTELAHSPITGAVCTPTTATDFSLLDKHDRHESSHAKHQQAKSHSESYHSEFSSRKVKPEDIHSSVNSPSDSFSSFRNTIHSGENSGGNCSPSHASEEQMINHAIQGKWRQRGAEEKKESEAGSSSIEEEVIIENNSLCSENIPSLNEKVENILAETEYSLKFDESMTEDDKEERSFRSLLPSEAHRRETKDKSHHQDESDDGACGHSMALVPRTHNILKDANMAFSGGQNSFSQFTMDMVRQYMKDEQVRLHHQSSLLHLRQKALEEKTKTELAWLEHQKKRLRDKGEDDKMPPIRKKQRGLLMKHQQEQAEIRRLQEANKAARKESQLLLKQQEEIERMRNSTLKLRERLKIAEGDPPPEIPVSETFASEEAASTMRHTEDVRSPSPSLSISGSETSSIMQKLRKMHSHMDEKFLTKREQKLMQRRHQAEKLLEWKQLLDLEEAEVRRMEKEALAVWNTQKSQDKDGHKIEISDISPSPSHHQNLEPRTDSEKDCGSEVDHSPSTSESSIHTEALDSQRTRSPSSVQSLPVTETHLASIQESPVNYTQDFTSASQSSIKQSPEFLSRGSNGPAASPSERSSKAMMQLCSSSPNNHQAHTQPTGSGRISQSEPISDQSDIETRIKTLKEELKKRKFMAYQLKKEQKKRHKERLKAQEANLLKQLQSYDKFIEKTKAELNKEPDMTKLEIQNSNSFAGQSSNKTPAQSSDSVRTQIEASLHSDVLHELDHSTAISVAETVAPSSVHDSPEILNSGPESYRTLLSPSTREAQMIEPGDESIDFYQRSNLQEEIGQDVRSKSEDQHLEQTLKLEKDDSLQRISTSPHEQEYSPSGSPEQDNKIRTNETSKAKEEGMSDVNTSPVSGLSEDCEIPAHLSSTFSSIDHSRSLDLGLISKEEDSQKDAKASSSITNEYDDDFELSMCSSPREEHHSSKPASRTSASLAESKGSSVHLSSQDEEIEEDIDAELAQFSEVTKGSNQSERLLDLLNKREDSIHEGKDVDNSIHSPPLPVTRTPPPPFSDEMSGFIIGDRVLVGGVQPGMLRFKGPTSFANGFWAGVELDKSEGSNNGTYDGVLYFVCEENHGIFAPPNKITHLPDKFEVYADTTEDEESFDDPSGERGVKRKLVDKFPNQNLKKENDQTSQDVLDESKKKNVSTESVFHANLELNSQSGNVYDHSISNGHTKDAILELEDLPHSHQTSGTDMDVQGKQSLKEVGHLDDKAVPFQEDNSASHLTTATADGPHKNKISLDTFADTLFKSFVNDIVQQFAEIKKVKEQKIETENQTNGDLFAKNGEEKIDHLVENKDGLPFFLPPEQEELSSPELCNRPQSPVLGPSGQEELAKRLAELELSREMLDDIGDDQDWFDEDFGLSSRREQQRLKKKEEEAKLGRVGAGEKIGVGVAMGGLVSSAAVEQQVKIPPRPELPLPLPPKLPEQPAMVVPNSAAELEKMVHIATQEIWEVCGLGKDGMSLQAYLPVPKPSQDYLGEEASGSDQEAACIRSYKKAVFDFTWEILQEIYAEDPNINQPQWVKPRRAKSSFYKIKTQGDISKTQEFIAAEVLKLYGLTKDQSQKTDWQKMLKFGRKKRDRVDQILVQELHEEESQWVNYDEDELFVKIQLADSIFDALLKDTVSMLNEIYEKKAKRKTPSQPQW